MDDLNTLIAAIEKWGIDKGLDKADPIKQYLKVAEETGEIAAGLARKNHAEVLDAIGDVGVTLIMQAMTMGVTFYDCLQIAYDQIKGRTGDTVDGIFVKAEDLPTFIVPELGEAGNAMVAHIPEVLRPIIEEATEHFIAGVKNPEKLENIPDMFLQDIIENASKAVLAMMATNITFKDEMIKVAKVGGSAVEQEAFDRTKEAITNYIQVLYAANMFGVDIQIHIVDRSDSHLEILEGLDIDVEDFKDFASDPVREKIQEEQEERAKEQDPTKMN